MNFPYGGTGRSHGTVRSTTEIVIPRPEAEESSRPILFENQTLGEIHPLPRIGEWRTGERLPAGAIHSSLREWIRLRINMAGTACRAPTQGLSSRVSPWQIHLRYLTTSYLAPLPENRLTSDQISSIIKVITTYLIVITLFY